MSNRGTHESGSESRFSEALLPLLFDLKYAPSILDGRQQIVKLFRTAYFLASEEIGQTIEKDDLRWELLNTAAFRASLAVVGIVEQHCGKSLGKQIREIFDAFLVSRVDPTLINSSSVSRSVPEQSLEVLMLALDAEMERRVFSLLAEWKTPAGALNRKALRAGREKRELRFIENNKARGIIVTSARIQRSAGIEHSTDYFAWRSGRRHRDGSDMSRVIEDVLSGRRPLL